MSPEIDDDTITFRGHTVDLAKRQLMAFQRARSRDPAGVGYGILIYDFARAAQRR
jgi:hypothetical protein